MRQASASLASTARHKHLQAHDLTAILSAKLLGLTVVSRQEIPFHPVLSLNLWCSAGLLLACMLEIPFRL